MLIENKDRYERPVSETIEGRYHTPSPWSRRHRRLFHSPDPDDPNLYGTSQLDYKPVPSSQLLGTNDLTPQRISLTPLAPTKQPTEIFNDNEMKKVA